MKPHEGRVKTGNNALLPKNGNGKERLSFYIYHWPQSPLRMALGKHVAAKEVSDLEHFRYLIFRLGILNLYHIF